MPRPSSRDAILDAAEAVVLESGASHMTLDAVAQRSGVSKGGLIYHFPTKEALLEAMIVRWMEHIEQVRESVRHDLSRESSNELMVDILTLQGGLEHDRRLSAALLAVTANQPELTSRIRGEMRERFTNRILSQGDFARSCILFFAALGLHFHDLLDLSLLNCAQRKEVFEELVRLAGSHENL